VARTTSAAGINAPFHVTGCLGADIAGYARWVTAKVVGDKEYHEFRRTLRHTSWKGLRPDVSDIANVSCPITAAGLRQGGEVGGLFSHPFCGG
jgi:hypothetical protein